jgi:hypothetical protein
MTTTMLLVLPRASVPRGVRRYRAGVRVVGKLTSQLAVALKLRAVVGERWVRRAATVEADLWWAPGGGGGKRIDTQVCADCAGLPDCHGLRAKHGLWDAPWPGR